MLLAEGLERLAAAGCTRFKVSFDPSNTAAARLYLGAGFRPVSRGPVAASYASRLRHLSWVVSLGSKASPDVRTAALALESSHRDHRSAEEMTEMYNAMNTDLMFQEMHDRADAMRAAAPGQRPEARRWWRRSAQRHAAERPP